MIIIPGINSIYTGARQVATSATATVRYFAKSANSYLLQRHPYVTNAALGVLSAINLSTGGQIGAGAGIVGMGLVSMLSRSQASKEAAFLFAVENNDLDTVHKMLDAGFESDIGMGNSEKHPFYAAVRLGSIEMVRTIVERTKLGYWETFANGKTPLGLAAELGHAAVAEYLIMSRGKPEMERSETNTGKTPLHCALEGGHLGIAKILIEKMDLPALTTRDKKGLSARNIAAKKGYSAILQLIDQKINNYPCNELTDFISLLAKTPFRKIHEEPNFGALKDQYGLKTILKTIYQIEDDAAFQKLKMPRDTKLDPCATIVLVEETLRTGKIPIPPHEEAGSTLKILHHYSPAFGSLTSEKQGAISEFLRRVNKYELVYALLQLNRLPPAMPENQELYALGDFISGKIEDVNKFSEILIANECRANKGRPLDLFINGRRNEEAIGLLKRSIGSYLSESEIEKFLTDPELQKVKIYSVPLQKAYQSVVTAILKTGFTFLTYSDGGEDHQIVMPPQMLAKLLEAKYGKLPPKLNPVLGPSVLFSNFENPNQRDVCVPGGRLFPRSQPDVADRLPASPLEFYHHDLFHYYLLSASPHRAAYIELASLVKGSQSPEERALHTRLLDQEFRSYWLSGNSLSPNDHFWPALEFIIDRSKAPPETMKLFLRHIQANQERWQNDYGITLPTPLKIVQYTWSLPFLISSSLKSSVSSAVSSAAKTFQTAISTQTDQFDPRTAG